MLDVLLKLFALDQLFAADVEYEGAIGRAQHAVDLVDGQDDRASLRSLGTSRRRSEQHSDSNGR